MAFIKEKLTDSYWENIDFKSFTPSQPRKPLYLMSDTYKEAILLPATDSYIARDGLEGFLLIFANRKIFTRSALSASSSRLAN
ncbi:MAG: hypothetical protein M0023_08635 [Desulfobacteraceae bacterium]|nr:hypothetical protein [Desulfobacteraceae bacterium]